MDLKSFSAARQVANANKENKENKYQEFFNEAKKLLEEFLASRNEKIMKKSVTLFFNALHCSRMNAEPYFYLSILFYFTDHTEKAKAYLKTAQQLNPALEGIANFRPLLYQV